MSLEQSSFPVYAALDIGSNTVHLVVALCQPDDLDILLDQVEVVRLGEGVNEKGYILPNKQQEALTLLRTYVEAARQHGATRILAVATEAVRRAKNGQQFLAEIKSSLGLDVILIDGEVEARLSFAGATYKAR